MKIKKSKLVALFAAVGFGKAPKWSDDKLLTKAEAIGKSVNEDEVPDDHKKLYNNLVNLDKDEELVLINDMGDEAEAEAPAEEPAPKKKKKAKAAPEETEEDDGPVDYSKMTKAELKSVIEENGLKVKIPFRKLEEIQKDVEAAMLAKNNPNAGDDEEEESEEEEAPKKKRKAKAAAKKDAKPAGQKVERDSFGCAVGTISHKVNEVVDDEWKSEQEIAEEAGVSLDQARGRLYYGAEKGVFEYRKRIEYRLVPAKKK